jgi:ribosomal protein S18 acetylase RimI-like enzyme
MINQKIENNIMKIEKSNEIDMPQLLNLYTSCTVFLQKNNMSHWDNYWNVNTIKSNIINNELYSLIINGEIVGAICISLEKPHYYKNKNTKSLYLSALAILPEHQNKGYGASLIRHAEDIASKKFINLITFDVLSDYEKLNKYYEKLGYKKLYLLSGKTFNYNVLLKKIIS